MVGPATARRHEFARSWPGHGSTRVQTDHTRGVRGDVGDLVLLRTVVVAEAVHVVPEDEDMFSRMTAHGSTREVIILFTRFSTNKIKSAINIGNKLLLPMTRNSCSIFLAEITE